MSEAQIRIAELFAGVGGFRLGFEKCNKKRAAVGFNIIWSNQYEPGTRIQHASDIYIQRFGARGHVNKDIEQVSTNEIPDHDILVGGFPCQDYSVASTLKNAKGLLGKKGVLWWQIHRIIEEKENKPKLLVLENVDRLLSSPASQRGKDMAVMLKSLSDLDYSVEWRVINAAEHGMPQRRKRVFMVGYHTSCPFAPEPDNTSLVSESVLSNAFPSKINEVRTFSIDGDLVQLSGSFNVQGERSPFLDSGFMSQSIVHTGKSIYKNHGSRSHWAILSSTKMRFRMNSSLNRRVCRNGNT